MTTFGGRAYAFLPTVLRAIAPEGKGVLCLKFIIQNLNLEIPEGMAMFSLDWSFSCLFLCFASASSTFGSRDKRGRSQPV